jgi:proline iminopeptidase
MVSIFASYDGTQLGYQVLGDGPPVVCLPGGPGRASTYLGDLGCLDATRQLNLLDPRGVGRSGDPADPATYCVDRLVEDVESFRVHLGLDRMDLLAHSPGAVLATLYAAAYPHRLSTLMLITPALAAVDVDVTDDDLTAALQRQADQPWYPDVLSALHKIMTGTARSRPSQRPDPSVTAGGTCRPRRTRW